MKVVKLMNQDKLRAYATICFDGKFLITGIKVINGKNGLFVAMPSKKNKMMGYDDICFPITKEMRAKISEDIINAYREKLEQEHLKNS